MESILNSAKAAFGNVFGNSESGPKYAGIASTLLFGLLGFAMGNGIGAVLGVACGAALGALANPLVEWGLKKLGIIPPINIPHINPEPQADASENKEFTIGGKATVAALPKPDALKRPWGAEGYKAYLSKLQNDTLKIVFPSISKKQSIDAQLKMIKECNKPYYDYLATAARYHADFKHYDQQTRSQWIKQLGMDNAADLDDLIGPPKYNKQPIFKLMDIPEDEIRESLQMPKDQWNQLNPVAKLAQAEEALTKQMLDLAADFAAWRKNVAALGHRPDININRLLDVTGWFGASLDTQAKQAVDTFLKNGDEQGFRHKMEEIAQKVSTGIISGEDSAEQVREFTSLAVEMRRIHVQWSLVQQIKKEWAAAAEAWLPDAMLFRKSLLDFAAQYSNGARANQHFTILKEFRVPLWGTKNKTTNEEIDEIKKKQEVSRIALKRSVDGSKALLDKLKGRDLSLLSSVDIDKDVTPLVSAFRMIESGELPVSDSRSTKPEEPNILLDGLKRAAQEYNSELAAFQAKTGNRENAVRLTARRNSLCDEIGHFLTYAKATYDAKDESREKKIGELAKASRRGTDLEGAEGVRFLVLDRRRKQTILLDGVKKDGKYLITGWTHATGGGGGRLHRFGDNDHDLNKALELTPATLKGLDHIMQRIDTSPQASGKIAPNVRDEARSSICFDSPVCCRNLPLAPPRKKLLAGMA